jgi:hypothetical protein
MNLQLSTPLHAAPVSANYAEFLQGERVMTDELSFEFECHYGNVEKCVRYFLEDILSDFSTYKQIHDWDCKLVTFPLETLATIARQYTRGNDHSLNMLLNHSMVEEVLTVDGINYPQPAMQVAGDIESFMLFTKVRSRYQYLA